MLVAIVIPVTVWVAISLRDYSNETSYKLCIKVPLELSRMQFTVRHIRDGAGDSPPGAISYKEDLPFPNPDADGRTCRDLSFPRHIGVMFKVYVTYKGVEFDRVKKILLNAGYID